MENNNNNKMDQDVLKDTEKLAEEKNEKLSSQELEQTSGGLEISIGNDLEGLKRVIGGIVRQR